MLNRDLGKRLPASVFPFARRLLRCAVPASLAAVLGACAWLVPKPAPLQTAELLDRFPDQVPWPVEQALTIRWQDNLVPFVEAGTDGDCAFAIGVLHAFLRLGQMEVFRRGSAGRLAESLGPIAAPDIDALLRKLELGRATEQNLLRLQPEDRRWLDRYLEGINFLIDHGGELPPEFDLLALRPEPWTAADSLRIGKLGSADPNWAILLGLLPLRDEPGWDRVWQRVLQGASLSIPTMAPASHSDALAGLDGLRLWMNLGARAGSNSVVVGGNRSARGAALIASDPHLGIFVPNLWLLMGYRCPSYEVVGYMLPGVPATTLGRNPRIAWGGTAMRGISSHLFEVEPEQITGTRTELIRIRGWPDRRLTVEQTISGPVVFKDSDPETGRSRRIALDWTGHRPGDDLGAFLGASRASDWASFRDAFTSISGPSLNITYADAAGHIGFLPAIRQPLLERPEQQNWLVKTPDNRVTAYRSPAQLPSLFDPPAGFIASANNLPVRTDPPLALPSADNGRKQRLDALAGAADSITVQTLMDWQQDVHSPDAIALRNLILERLGEGSGESPLVARLRGWDGEYRVDASGAVAYEILARQLAIAVSQQLPPSESLRRQWLALDDWRMALHDWLQSRSVEDSRALILKSLPAAEHEAKRFATWGQWHRQPLQSPLGLLPWLGRRYRYGDFPAPGGSATVHKASFAAGTGPRDVIFGAQARHISDLADLDENYFAMLGGNAGWLDNAALIDQVDLWRQG